MRECKGICLRLDEISFGVGEKIYTDGVKFCKTCDRFLEINGYRCLCCKSSVRTKSHAKRWRNKIRGLRI